jgi:hypothetical protein
VNLVAIAVAVGSLEVCDIVDRYPASDFGTTSRGRRESATLARNSQSSHGPVICGEPSHAEQGFPANEDAALAVVIVENSGDHRGAEKWPAAEVDSCLGPAVAGVEIQKRGQYVGAGAFGHLDQSADLLGLGDGVAIREGGAEMHIAVKALCEALVNRIARLPRLLVRGIEDGNWFT